MTHKNDNSLLKHALEYHERGWCIIPIRPGSKEAMYKWKAYQSERPSEAQLGKWFADNGCNIAVVLGPVSGDLVCRDFDSMADYERWAAECPDLAQKLARVRTSRGMHVYFQAGSDGTKYLANGELRGAGGYCLLPPSIHPDGSVYQWEIPVSNGNLLVVEPELAGLLNRKPDVTEESRGIHRSTEEIVLGGKIEKVLKKTLPTKTHTRHRRIFDFARELHSMPQFAEEDPKQFRSVVKEWHRRALPNIETKEFEETWIDFLKAWPRIKWKIGEHPMAEIVEKSMKLKPPKIAALKYPDNHKLKTLVALCRELQRAAGNNPFFLSARTAARLLGTTPMTASRGFFLLETDEILKVVTKGKMTTGGGVATRFKYIADG